MKFQICATGFFVHQSVIIKGIVHLSGSFLYFYASDGGSWFSFLFFSVSFFYHHRQLVVLKRRRPRFFASVCLSRWFDTAEKKPFHNS